MLTLKLDTTSSLSIRWPRTYRTVVQLGEAYAVYEGGLAPQAQLQDITLAMIQTALTEAQTAIAAAQSGESGRGSSAADV